MEQIMDNLSEPGIDDFAEFERLRTELYEHVLTFLFQKVAARMLVKVALNQEI